MNIINTILNSFRLFLILAVLFPISIFGILITNSIPIISISANQRIVWDEYTYFDNISGYQVIVSDTNKNYPFVTRKIFGYNNNSIRMGLLFNNVSITNGFYFFKVRAFDTNIVPVYSDWSTNLLINIISDNIVPNIIPQVITNKINLDQRH